MKPGIYLLDTSALLAHARRELGWERVQAVFEEPGVTVLIASPTVTEFARRLVELGATRAEALANVAAYTDVVDEVVAIDATVAGLAFELGAELPGRLPLVDALIAGAARARRATLVHRDRHMGQIPRRVLSQLDLGEERGEGQG